MTDAPPAGSPEAVLTETALDDGVRDEAALLEAELDEAVRDEAELLEAEFDDVELLEAELDDVELLEAEFDDPTVDETAASAPGAAPEAARIDPVAFPQGGQAGRYRASRVIGIGGMADVYLAQDTVLGREVAVKVFRAEPDGPADRLGREREIRLLVGFNHPGLVGVFDAGWVGSGDDVRRFVVMEHVPNGTLAQRIADGGLSERQVADIGAQTADALAYVHARSVMHLDVKPDNILLDDEPALGYTVLAKLADFGVARIVDATELVGDGPVVGTAAYLSPEQARGEDAVPASDVYGLGLVLLECLTGVREYGTGTAVESALARLERAPQIPADLPADWRGILAAMTADHPAARPSADEVAAAMRDLIRSMVLRERGEPAHHPTSARRAGRLWSSRRPRV
ncbi:serine/threonine-protein kinase [Agromyces sp. MMS24-JH15]|uniref:serine/threonine-protein kinase n=1 Tax=Agromyces sp. MMS24-JH15 TaxID=3243765 RepID=UPI0037498676